MRLGEQQQTAQGLGRLCPCVKLRSAEILTSAWHSSARGSRLGCDSADGRLILCQPPICLSNTAFQIQNINLPNILSYHLLQKITSCKSLLRIQNLLIYLLILLWKQEWRQRKYVWENFPLIGLLPQWLQWPGLKQIQPRSWGIGLSHLRGSWTPEWPPRVRAGSVRWDAGSAAVSSLLYQTLAWLLFNVNF